MKFLDAVKTEENKPTKTLTTNGAVAFDKTGDNLLEYFYKVGARRGLNNLTLFMDAFREDQDTAIRLLLWTRDVREGLGERNTFRDIINFLANENHSVVLRLMKKIPELGRWDDLLSFVDTPFENEAFELIKQGLQDQNQLCAKWMPRKGSIAVKLRNFLGMSPKQYRKTLVNLTNVVETKMCDKEWKSIEFSKVPSIASQKYRNAFLRNDEDRYRKWLNDITTGKSKVNAGAIYPHLIVKPLLSNTYSEIDKDAVKLCNAQWEALPNFVPENSSVLPMIDVSGSMDAPAGTNSSVRCIDVAVSLGLYLTMKNTGPFKGAWLNFTDRPTLRHLKGTSLYENLQSLDWRDWGYNTDIESAFDEILCVAIHNNVSQEDLPKTLIIFSDMQFDEVRGGSNKSLFIQMKKKFKEHGYKLPNVVFWNLRDCNNVPVKKDKNGTALVSGFSPSLMKSVLVGDIDKFNPMNIMLDTISNSRYNY